MAGLIYLASPYSDPDPSVKEARFRAVCKVAANLMARGVLVFSPIAHTHPIALACSDMRGGSNFLAKTGGRSASSMYCSMAKKIHDKAAE